MHSGSGSREIRGRFVQKRISNLHIQWRIKKLKDQNGICAICNKKINHKTENEFMAPSLDHIIPLVAHGIDHWENVQVVHMRCNVKKGCLMPGIQDYAFRFRQELSEGVSPAFLAEEVQVYIDAILTHEDPSDERDRALSQLKIFLDEIHQDNQKAA